MFCRCRKSNNLLLRVLQTAAVGRLTTICGSALLAGVVLGLPAADAQTAAEKPGSVAPLPPEIGNIPGPALSDKPLLVGKPNVSSFEDLLVTPLMSWLKDGRFVCRVIRNIGFLWELSAEWENASRANAGRFDVDAEKNLVRVGQYILPTGLPFGGAEAINQEPDPEKKAYKILWNSAAAALPVGDISYLGEIDWESTQGLLRKASATFYQRLVPAPKAPEKPAKASSEKPEQTSAKAGATTTSTSITTTTLKPAPVLYRQDFLRLLAPPVIANYSELSWRYQGVEPDLFWIYSPVLNKVRQVFPANRSDPIMGGTLDYDDLFVWAGKVQSVDAKLIADKVMLVPFPALMPIRAVDETTAAAALDLTPGSQDKAVPHSETALTARGGFQRGDSTASVLWNFETRQLPQAAAWTPTSVYFVPRRVWVLELAPLDPFYGEGRQVLIVDQESMLPVYRIAYDRKGAFLKFVVGGWHLATTDNHQIRFPILGFLLVVDQTSNKATSFTLKSARTFQGRDTAAARDVQKFLDVNIYATGAKKAGVQQTTTSTSAPAEAPKAVKPPAAVPQETAPAGGTED